MDRARLPARVHRPGERLPTDRVEGRTAEQLFAMAGQITLDAWEFLGEPVEPRLPRHVVRVVRRGR